MQASGLDFCVGLLEQLVYLAREGLAVDVAGDDGPIPLVIGEPFPLSLQGVRRLSGGRRAGYGAAARGLTLAARAESRVAPSRPARFMDLAERANRIAGVADLDRDGTYVARYFARPG